MGHEMFQLTEVGENRFHVFQPSEAAEGRDVVFSGQLMAQSLGAVYQTGGRAKPARSVHSIFARAGSYQSPIELTVDPMHGGRSWASDTATCTQGGKLLCRSLVLSHAPDPHLFQHAAAMPDVPGPDECPPAAHILFPGAEARMVPGEPSVDGVAAMYLWHRFVGDLGDAPEHQGVLAWASCGAHIGLAMRDHGDIVKITDAHRSVSTGVIAHTVHFLDTIDATEWLLLTHEATHAGDGRVFGQGSAYTVDGRLVATYEQDSMARGVGGPLDPSRAM